MVHNYKQVSIYIDLSGNLIIIPMTVEEMQGVIGGAIIDIDIPHFLKASYTDTELEIEIMKAFDECYSKEADVKSRTSVIEKFLKIKGWLKATKDKKLVNVWWSKDDGYKVTPTNNKQKNGFTHISENSIKLGQQFVSGGLAKAVRDAINMSTLPDSLFK